jgi:hypothetical protein
LTNTDSEEQMVFTEVYGTKSFQVQDTGTFRWEANDPGCLVIQRQGPGNAILPFAHQGGGDSDAFETGGKITVEIADFLGNGECDLLLRDAANGQDLDFGTVTQGGDPSCWTPADDLRCISRACNVTCVSPPHRACRSVRLRDGARRRWQIRLG